MFTIDVVALITRITNLEQETQSLRKALASTEERLSDRIEEVQQSVFDQMPKLKDGNLLIETYDDKSQTVYAQVKPREIIAAEAEQ